MPVRSMTGYGLAEAETPIGTLRVEIRSVNNRYLEQSCYMPRHISAVESKVKKLIQGAVTRGTVTTSIGFERAEGGSTALTLNKALAGEYVKLARELKKTYGLEGDVSVADVLRYPDVIATGSHGISEELVFKNLKPVVEKALVAFIAAREKEGAFTLTEMKKILKNIEKVLGQIEKIAPSRLKAQSAALKEKIEKLVGKVVDPSRLATEAALLSDKLDIAEEITRLKSHIVKMRDDMADENEPLGKKLGFLLQEMNREANTIGSKANDAQIAHLSVSLKEDIERIREQSLNIE